MSACVACGSEFQCGMVDAGAAEPCWCTQLPPLPASALAKAAASGNAGCYCPDCLRALVTTGDAGPAQGQSRNTTPG